MADNDENKEKSSFEKELEKVQKLIEIDLHEIFNEPRSKELILAKRNIFDVKPPLDVEISGGITSPMRWLESRHETFNDKESHAIVDFDNRSILLVINETNSNGSRFEIEGKVSLSKIFLDLGINSSCISYSPVELANKLKLMRSIFPNTSDHASICSTLRNLKAKINKKLEESDDRRGNTSSLFEQTVESNMPETFKIEIPLLKGGEKITFDLAVILEAKGGEIKCFLESVEAAEKIDLISEELIQYEVEHISKFTTLIYK